MNKPSVYLAGPITGTTYSETTSWREIVTQALQPNIVCFSPMRHKEYLLNETSIGDCYNETILSSQRGIFARDTFDCSHVTALFVNLLGAKRVSIGTVIEISLGWAYRKPIILMMEKEGNLHDHAMIREACPFIVHTLEDGIDVTRTLLIP